MFIFDLEILIRVIISIVCFIFGILVLKYSLLLDAEIKEYKRKAYSQGYRDGLYQNVKKMETN